MEVVISAGAGLLAGIVGSLVAPWVHWGIERRRAQMNGRRELITSARETMTNQDDMLSFIQSDAYHQLKPFLSNETNMFLADGPSHIMINQHGGDHGVVRIVTYQEMVRKDLSELERKWKLV